MIRTRILFIGLSIAVGVPVASAQTSAATAPAGGTRSASPTVPARAVVPTLLKGTPGTAFSTIQGRALDSTNGILPDSPVRLRDARFGRIIGKQRTDKSGLFEFPTIDPGSYIVELLDRSDTVLAASQLINVNAGEAVSTVVKLPLRLPPLGGFLGHTTRQVIGITAAAAATGVLVVAKTTDVSSDGTN